MFSLLLTGTILAFQTSVRAVPNATRPPRIVKHKKRGDLQKLGWLYSTIKNAIEHWAAAFAPARESDASPEPALAYVYVLTDEETERIRREIDHWA